MEDQELITQIQQFQGRSDPQSKASYNTLIQQIREQAASYQQSDQIWKGITLLRQARQIITPMPDLAYEMAYILGSRVELIMRWSDLLKILPPADLLSRMEADLEEAISIFPDGPDLYWNMAVVKARFEADYNAASKYLESAMALGYEHPMLRNLQTLIQNKPPLTTFLNADEIKLRELFLRLAEQTISSDSVLLNPKNISSISTNSKTGSLKSQTLGDFVQQAIEIIARQGISQAEYLQVIDDIESLGKNRTVYGLDILRQVAEFTKDQPLLDQITDRLLRFLYSEASLCLTFSQGISEAISKDILEDTFNEQVHSARHSGLAEAEYGLNIIETSTAKIDPLVHAGLLNIKGGILAYEGDPRELPHATALLCYHQALSLVRQTNNNDLIESFQNELWKQIRMIFGLVHQSRLIGAVPGITDRVGSDIIGEILDILRICIEIIDDLGTPPPQTPGAMNFRLLLAVTLREQGAYGEAEQVLHTILQKSKSDYFTRGAQLELASVYGETSRAREAVAIYENLLDHEDFANEEYEYKSKVWANYANSLSLLHDYKGALVALENAWNLLPLEQKQVVDPNNTGSHPFPSQAIHAKMQLAQVHVKLEDYAEALKDIEIAEALRTIKFRGLDDIQFEAVKAECLIGLKKFNEARDALNKALEILHALLKKGPSFPFWERLLPKWTHLDARVIRMEIEEFHNCEQAFLYAESAKGRVTAWLERQISPDSTDWVLSLGRQVQALEETRKWLSEQPNRRVASLFATNEGLGIFALDQTGQISGAWLNDFNYECFLDDIYVPWTKLIEQASNSNNSDVLKLASSQTDYLLDLVGTWIWRVQPDLAKGGTDLIILPHRAFRNLPLGHIRFPTGDRLSDLFQRVFIVPSLGDLGRSLQSSATLTSQTTITALADADADDPLPFARCEAILSGAGQNITLGSMVTEDAVSKGFEHEGILLLSLHGDFDEKEPFASKIFTSDGEFLLTRLMFKQIPIRCQIVVLGVCEAGRYQSSVSDEPIGFPTMLLQGGITTILAPVWQVDDLASFLFFSKLFEELNKGTDFVCATQDAVRWLRELTTEATLQRIEDLMSRLEKSGELGETTLETVWFRLDEQKRFLKTLSLDEKPFRTPLDWAAFQVNGLLPTNISLKTSLPSLS
jgi:tetratricopeptide (TPR) repeat protein